MTLTQGWLLARLVLLTALVVSGSFCLSLAVQLKHKWPLCPPGVGEQRAGTAHSGFSPELPKCRWGSDKKLQQSLRNAPAPLCVLDLAL